MKKFDKIKAIAAPLPMINVDTDMIIPKQFLKTIKRSGLGKNLFHELRYDINGNLKNDFVLNWEFYKNAKILITGDNFGCGSSREHAPWSLLDFGFRCIIAPSFADIFFNNCFKNSVLPIKLEKSEIEELFSLSKDHPIIISVNIREKAVVFEDKLSIKFNLDDNLAERIIFGLDEIDITLKDSKLIKEFEEHRKESNPWIFE